MFIKILLTLTLFLCTNSVDYNLQKCKQKLGRYAERQIFIYNNICFVKNYKIYKDVDSFLTSAVRKF